MFKVKRTDRSKKRRRTALEIEEEQTRTLYIRIPHTIKNVDEVKSLFFGDFKVKLPRQSTRYCHVIFNDVEDKIKNLKAVKKKLIDGKPIYAGPPKPMNLEKKKPKQKKIKLPDPSAPSKHGKYILVSKIPPGVKASEVKSAFPGATTVALLKGLVKGHRNAKLKMSSPQLCLHYTKRENWPVLKEQKVCVRIPKKSSRSKNKKQKNTEPLKIYDGEDDQKEQSKVKDEDSKKADSAESDEEDEVSEEEDDETEEESSEEAEEEEDED